MKTTPVKLPASPEVRQAAAEKYGSYGEEWEKACFDKYSGGYNVYHKGHQFAPAGGGGEAEKTVGKMLAKLGKQVEFLPEGKTKSPDFNFDDKTWDVKYIDKANEETIRSYIKDARKADNVIFYFTREEKYLQLVNSINRQIGYFVKKNKLQEVPDIYYMEVGSGLLKLLWEKQKGSQ
jgi:hypothetical protein